LLALGRANWLLRFTALWFVASLLSFALGVQWGVIGVAACYAGATMLVEPVRTYITARALDVSPWRLVSALSGVAQAAALMGVLVLASRAALVALDVSAAARLAILVVLGASTYLLFCVWRAPDAVLEIRNVAGRRRDPVQAAPEPIATLERVESTV
jgi:PST family polysaccharide transporter